ncbi:MAG: Npt1/Npt2 family nucleotide transporter [Pseudomonadota bacterium]
MSIQPGGTSFSKIRLIFWPIEREELKLFVPMALLMLCILFNFSVLRSIKDSLVVPSIGAEAISFLKLWLVLPSAILFTVIYVKLSNILKIDQIFYILISTFLLVFILFAYVIYPSQGYYHPSASTIDLLLQSHPYLQWFIKLFSKWSYAVIYIFGELWSVAVINLMFWQFANHMVETSQARRFYPMFGLVGNTGIILAGNVIVYFAGVSFTDELLPESFGGPSAVGAHITLKLMVASITVSGIIAMLIFRYINKIALHDKDVKLLSGHNIHDTQTKLSLKESIKLVMSSRYIGYIVLMIICYGLIINILEGPWKAKLRELYPTTIEYITFMGNFNIWMGSCSVFFMLLGSNALRKFSWLTSALITPSIIGITGGMFFTFVVFPEYFASSLQNIAFDPLYAAVLVGAAQNILSKSTKYSLFDSTKEMTYIPLSIELRTKGKAAAEVIGAKIGKSLGALVQSSIFTFVPLATFDSIAPLLMVIFIIVIALWIADVHKLNKEYTEIIPRSE